MYRIHWADQHPWWFNSDGSQRFDLEVPQGTCYLAERPLGAFVEVGTRLAFIDPEELALRALARLRVARPLRLADALSPRAAGLGATARISAGSDYAAADSQPWARALADAGFDGIRYGLSHEPGLRLRGFALFGQAGEHPGYGQVDDGAISAALVDEAMARFGFRYAP